MLSYKALLMEWKDFKLVESRTAFATALFLFCSLLFFSMLCLFVVFATRNNNFLTSSSSRNTKMPHHTFYRMYDYGINILMLSVKLQFGV